jgi:hypothetical protein
MWEFIVTTNPISLLCALGGAAVVLLLAGIVLVVARRRTPAVEIRSRWVLLALGSDSRAEDLAGEFQDAGWDTQILPPDAGLGEFLAGFHPSLLVVDRSRHGADLAQLEIADARVASTPILLLDVLGAVDRGAQQMRAWVEPNAKIPVILEKAEQLVGRHPGPQQLSRLSEVRGPLRQGTILELLYFLANACRTGRVEIATDGVSGWIWLEGGEVRHAVLGREEGTNALHFLLDRDRGQFSFRAGASAPDRTIKSSTIYLLHEYARLRDEHAKMAGN